MDQTRTFVDASAWIAGFNRRDQHHPAANAHFESLLAANVGLVTTTWTAYEALSVIKSRAGWQVAAALWDLLTVNPSIDMVRIDAEIEAQALELFFAYQDKTWGVVDCASLIVMQETGCRQAFGFDHHFVEASRQRGFKLLPGGPQD